MVVATNSSQYQVRALERALQILGAFSLERPERSLSELSMMTDLAPSTTLRLLSILAQHGYVERSPDTDRFRIGVGMFERGSIYIQTTSVEAESREALVALARDTNQTASVAVLDRGEIVHIAVVQPERAIRYYAPVGQREMAHCTGLGKALLSGLSDAELQEVIEQRGLPSRTDRTITTIAQLRTHLATVRERGYAMDNEESIVGLRCVAAPIRDDRNRVVAAVSASGASAEFTEETLPGIIEAVRATARAISTRMGNRVQHEPAADGVAARVAS
jgi:DNA-binding IclR family transcriptional regulator